MNAESNPFKEIDDLIAKQRILICCGSGGVGKTTMSAVLAIRGAMLGKNAVVITIDPAKRLATSLGLKTLDSQPQDLTSMFPKMKGHFHAVMPDTTQTFENFVKSMAGENKGLAARILKTSIYKIFTREFSGANEYMAMEKLFQLNLDPRFDLIVLDTPPSANTKHFLEAPTRLAQFFDDRMMQWFVKPGSRLLATGIKKVLEILERLTGQGFISDLIEFTSALFELRFQFIENLRDVDLLLHKDEVSFMVVTSPERLSKKDSDDFVDLLREREYPFWGYIVNRVLSKKLGWPLDAALDRKDYSAQLPTPDLELLLPRLRAEKDAFEFLSKKNVVAFAEQDEDVHSAMALHKLASEMG